MEGVFCCHSLPRGPEEAKYRLTPDMVLPVHRSLVVDMRINFFEAKDVDGLEKHDGGPTSKTGVEQGQVT